jgi:hypothetical protein
MCQGARDRRVHCRSSGPAASLSRLPVRSAGHFGADDRVDLCSEEEADGRWPDPPRRRGPPLRRLAGDHRTSLVCDLSATPNQPSGWTPMRGAGNAAGRFASVAPDRAVDNWLTEPRRNVTTRGKPRLVASDSETAHLQGKSNSERPSCYCLPCRRSWVRVPSAAWKRPCTQALFVQSAARTTSDSVPQVSTDRGIGAVTSLSTAHKWRVCRLIV